MASVRWCGPSELTTADHHEIVCLARTPPVRWDPTAESFELPAEELRALVDAEHELLRLVTPLAQVRMHPDNVIFVGRRSLADHCLHERQYVTAETLNDPAIATAVATAVAMAGATAVATATASASSATGPMVRLQLILRKRNLTFGLRSGFDDDDDSVQERFSVGWELDAVLYEDADWPF